MKFSSRPVVTDTDGTEQIAVLQGIGPARDIVLMSPSLFADAAARPTNAELVAAVIAAIVEGAGISVTPDAVAGTVTIAVDAGEIVTGDELTTAIATRQAASANLAAIAALVLAGNDGKVLKIAGGAFTLGDDELGAGGGGLVDGTFGDVVITGGGTVLTVKIAADEAYGVGWNADLGPASKNALYVKLEALAASIAGKVATGSIGAANGVASLDAGGKVPAGQLPSYVDDVLEYASSAEFPPAGEAGKIYVSLASGRQSRWAGSAYVELTASPGTTDAVPEGSANRYFTDARAMAAIATGLADTVGTPAATDSLLTILGKIKKALFTDLPATIRGTVLTGLSTATGGAIAAADTVLAAFGKIQNSLDSLTTAIAGKADGFSSVNSYAVNQAVADAAHNNNYNRMTGATTRTITFGSPTAGHTSVWANRGTVNMTIACAGGYYKNGAAATATANLTLAPGGKLTAFHEGAGVWTFDGAGF